MWSDGGAPATAATAGVMAELWSIAEWEGKAGNRQLTQPLLPLLVVVAAVRSHCHCRFLLLFSSSPSSHLHCGLLLTTAAAIQSGGRPPPGLMWAVTMPPLPPPPNPPKNPKQWPEAIIRPRRCRHSEGGGGGGGEEGRYRGTDGRRRSGPFSPLTPQTPRPPPPARPLPPPPSPHRTTTSFMAPLSPSLSPNCTKLRQAACTHREYSATAANPKWGREQKPRRRCRKHHVVRGRRRRRRPGARSSRPRQPRVAPPITGGRDRGGGGRRGWDWEAGAGVDCGGGRVDLETGRERLRGRAMKGISSRMVGQPLSIPRHKECHDFLGVPLASLAIDRSALLRIHLIPYVFLLLYLYIIRRRPR